MVRHLIPGVMACAAMTALPASAQERFTEVWGGRGGKQFVLRCPAQMALTGVSVLAGAYVNNIAPMCDGRRMAGAGGGGDRSSAVCPSGSVVRKMFIVSLRSDNHLLKSVTLYCFPRGGGAQTAEVSLDTPGRYTQPALRWQSYPATTVGCGDRNAIGLQGRSGASVDAVGLICG